MNSIWSIYTNFRLDICETNFLHLLELILDRLNLLNPTDS